MQMELLVILAIVAAAYAFPFLLVGFAALVLSVALMLAIFVASRTIIPALGPRWSYQDAQTGEVITLSRWQVFCHEWRRVIGR